MAKHPKILMLRGLPASGKTTFAKNLCDNGWNRVNKDELRSMINNGKFSRSKEESILKMRDFVIIDSISSGKNIVVDDTNLDPKHLDKLKEIASEYNADLEIKDFDVPVRECIKRNSLRSNPVPEKVIYNMYQRYIMPKEVKQAEYDDSKLECIIVDVDGTLAHIVDGRSPYDASRAMNDALDDAVSSIVSMAYQNGYLVFIVTGRNETYKEVTEQWLKTHGVLYDGIYTRKLSDVDENGQELKDCIVKENIYHKYIEPCYNVKFVLDDRNQVVDMWRSLGIKCLQVQEGNF